MLALPLRRRRLIALTFTLAGVMPARCWRLWGSGPGGRKGGRAGPALAAMLLIAVLMMSTGTGNITVELFSAEMLFRVCKYRS